MYFDHTDPQFSPPTPPRLPLFPSQFYDFFVFSPLSQISTVHVGTGVGHSLKRGSPSRGHIPEWKGFFLQQPSPSNSSSVRVGPWEPLPHACWNFDWCDSVQMNTTAVGSYVWMATSCLRDTALPRPLQPMALTSFLPLFCDAPWASAWGRVGIHPIFSATSLRCRISLQLFKNILVYGLTTS